MKKFYIISRDDRPERMEIINKITSYIEKNGGTCGYTLIDSVPYGIPKDTQCVISLGGDGTFARAIQRSTNYEIPFIGCNLGHLGYLCELDSDTIIPSLERMMNENIPCQKRMLLEGGIDGHAMLKAVNDVVLKCSSNTQIANLCVEVNGQYLYSYNCDGIIVSTPTGSTGYNLSTGGPIVDPSARVILVTPLNAHALNTRSIVLGAEDEVRIRLMPRKRGSVKENVDVRIDGALCGTLKVGDSVTVRASEASAKVFMLSNLSFLERIRKKMMGD